MADEERKSEIGNGKWDNGANQRPVSRFPFTISAVLQWTAVALAAVIALVFISTLILGRTDWGRERVRRIVLGRLQAITHGQVTIGRITGNLLTGATIESFAIRDSLGNPFFVAERISARYRLLELLTKKIDLNAVYVEKPLVVLDRLPGRKWNFQEIFPTDPTGPRLFSWIIFHNATVRDGHLFMRTPWKPDTGLSRAAQDSSIREALSGTARILVVKVPGGYQKIVELKEVNARAPFVRLLKPGENNSLAQIATLSMVALPFRPPSAVVNDMVGTLRFTRDSVWWRDAAVAMPGSKLVGAGRYVFTTGDMSIEATARPAAFADFRWVFPRFPSEGGGPLDFALEWRGTTQEYWVRNADVRTQGARLQGKFAISFADTFAIHDTDIRFANVSTRLIEQLTPDLQLPRRGTLDGKLEIIGGRNAMHLAGDVAFHDITAGTSRASGRGFMGLTRDGEIRLRDLRVHANPLQVALIKALSPAVAQTLQPIGGVIVGDLTINGSTRSMIAVSGDVRHQDRGVVSRVSGRSEVRFARVPTINADLVAKPVALAELGLLMPSLGLRGSASGPVRIRGTLSNLHVVTNLRVNDGGTVALDGRFDVEGRGKSYNLTASANQLNLNAVMANAPKTVLTGRLSAQGTGGASRLPRCAVRSPRTSRRRRGTA